MNYKIKELLHGEPHFVDPVPQDLLCMLCKNIMIDATYIPCGCEFCRKCLENYFENKEKQCPCKDEMHPSNESKYEFQHDSVRSHPTNSKILRLKVKCKKCEEVKSVEEMSKHKDECNKRTKCLLFGNFGCNETVNSDDLSNHMIEDIVNHNQIMLDLINNLTNEQYSIKNSIKNQLEENNQLKVEMRILQEEIISIKEENLQLKDEFENYRTKIDSAKKENNQMKDEMRNCRVEIDSIKEENRLLKCQNEALESRLQQMDKINADQQSRMEATNRDKENILTNIKSIESKINDIDSKSKKDNAIILKEVNLINQYMWTIEDFANKRNQHMEICSDIFYTHRSGYRIRLLFDTKYPNYHNFLVSFQLMKEEFNDGLPWPMRRKIKLCVINQDTGKDSDVSYIFYYDEIDDDCNKCFNKPTEHDNVPCGQQFNYNKIYNGRYRDIGNPLIKNDKIIIKCVTYPPD